MASEVGTIAGGNDSSELKLSKKHESRWEAAFEAAAFNRIDVNAKWQAGSLGQANDLYQLHEAQQKARILQQQRRNKRRKLAIPKVPSIDEFTWKVGNLCIRLPVECEMPPEVRTLDQYPFPQNVSCRIFLDGCFLSNDITKPPHYFVLGH